MILNTVDHRSVFLDYGQICSMYSRFDKLPFVYLNNVRV